MNVIPKRKKERKYAVMKIQYFPLFQNLGGKGTPKKIVNI